MTLANEELEGDGGVGGGGERERKGNVCPTYTYIFLIYYCTVLVICELGWDEPYFICHRAKIYGGVIRGESSNHSPA